MFSLDPELSLRCASEFGQLKNWIGNTNTKSSFQVIECYVSKIFSELCKRFHACMFELSVLMLQYHLREADTV